MVSTLLPKFQNRGPETPNYHIVGKSLVLNSAKGGRLVFRNLQGQIVWSGDVGPGVARVPLPGGFHEILWVASLNGAKASLVFMNR